MKSTIQSGLTSHDAVFLLVKRAGGNCNAMTVCSLSPSGERDGVGGFVKPEQPDSLTLRVRESG
jgi:hypothetical protein